MDRRDFINRSLLTLGFLTFGGMMKNTMMAYDMNTASTEKTQKNMTMQNLQKLK